jgi:hypothetical protein
LQLPQPTGWFDVGNGQMDYLYSTEPDAVMNVSSVHLDGHEYPFRMLSASSVHIQLVPDVAQVLAGGSELSTLFRRAGVGRVRKDLSTPLKPPADRIWIQALNRDPLLVWRRESGPDHAAFFRLQRLSQADRSVGTAFGRVPVLFVVADDFLPRASWQHFVQVVEQRQAFGALIACTEDG